MRSWEWSVGFWTGPERGERLRRPALSRCDGGGCEARRGEAGRGGAGGRPGGGRPVRAPRAGAGAAGTCWASAKQRLRPRLLRQLLRHRSAGWPVPREAGCGVWERAVRLPHGPPLASLVSGWCPQSAALRCSMGRVGLGRGTV